MANLVEDLNSLDFSKLIGAPLQATIMAQHEAALAQVEFINAVGFEVDPVAHTKKLRYVDFEFEKSKPNPSYNSSVTGSLPYLIDKVSLKVPILGMLNLGGFSVEEITIDFNAKLTSVETKSVSSDFSASLEFGLQAKIVNLKVSASYKHSTSAGSNVEKSYTLAVHVRAGACDPPAGFMRILDMLEDSIQTINH